ncbi:MAG: PA2778 family cysteine peptidase [Desulfobulbaceae bacterium]|nr:PA2778 family cysteine peptidase [Desulfobulbaceae bacterium]
MHPQQQSGSRLNILLPILIAGITLLSACSPASHPALLTGAAGEADRAIIEGVPFYPQEKFQCGPASLAMVLNWSGLHISPEKLVPEVYTPGREGGLQSALIASARRHGRIAYPITGMDMLFAELNAGRPALVLLNLSFSWFPRWHYAVVYGYDREAELFFLHSGTREGEELSFRVFNNIWSRSGFWGLLVLPPSEMPVKVDAATWLEAAAGLELANEWRAAETAFSKAAGQWPHNYNAWIGLGNSRYALHDLQGAVTAFETAVRIRPDSGIAYNNLAQVLAARGNFKEALAASRHAVRLGGPFLETFLETEREVLLQAEQDSLPGKL